MLNREQAVDDHSSQQHNGKSQNKNDKNGKPGTNNKLEMVPDEKEKEGVLEGVSP